MTARSFISPGFPFTPLSQVSQLRPCPDERRKTGVTIQTDLSCLGETRQVGKPPSYWPLGKQISVALGPGNAKLRETAKPLPSYKAFGECGEENRLSPPGEAELRQSEVHILKGLERRLSHSLDYLVCQSVSKNLARLHNRSFGIDLILACLWDALWNVHTHHSNGKSFKKNYPLHSPYPLSASAEMSSYEVAAC